MLFVKYKRDVRLNEVNNMEDGMDVKLKTFER